MVANGSGIVKFSLVMKLVMLESGDSLRMVFFLQHELMVFTMFQNDVIDPGIAKEQLQSQLDAECTEVFIFCTNLTDLRQKIIVLMGTGSGTQPTIIACFADL